MAADISNASSEPPVGSIRRTLRIVQALAVGPQPLRLVAEATNLPKPSVLRTLRICEEEGFVREIDGRWQLSTLLWRLGVGAVDQGELSASVQEVLTRLVAETGETAVYSVYENGHVVYVDQVDGTHPIRAHVRRGNRAPALLTATGLSILARRADNDLSDALASVVDRPSPDEAEVRERLGVIAADGYALNTDGMWPGLWGIAAAVLDRSGNAIAGIGLAAPTDRRPSDPGPLGEAVMAAADRLSAIDTSRRGSTGAGRYEQ